MGIDLIRFDDLQAEIQRQSKVAGAGNFDRTVFQRSNEVTINSPITSVTTAFAKFIAPQAGVYQCIFDFEYGSEQKSSHTILYRYADIEIQRCHCAAEPAIGGVYSDWCSNFFDISLNEYYTSIYSVTFERIFTKTRDTANQTANFINLKNMFYLRKGEPVIFAAICRTNTSDYAFFKSKNLKITY